MHNWGYGTRWLVFQAHHHNPIDLVCHTMHYSLCWKASHFPIGDHDLGIYNDYCHSVWCLMTSHTTSTALYVLHGKTAENTSSGEIAIFPGCLDNDGMAGPSQDGVRTTRTNTDILSCWWYHFVWSPFWVVTQWSSEISQCYLVPSTVLLGHPSSSHLDNSFSGKSMQLLL